ncbi:carboxylating nicotinate-nucleotide diphosphorylase [Thermonema rossianum]|uniref:carboxylating nicotinate-nucleotide diphosphorylase n=1 Tax=Thermonema rossianum TaxID=55505 RepID=UPI000570B11B|nr:carboxylating nicotinate-nucleotide diphosphorylase [Thermonema rossianum]
MNRPGYIQKETILRLIDLAIQEDIGEGDHSTLASVPANAQKEAILVMKADGVIAGVELAGWIFRRIDPQLQVEAHAQDGDQVKSGDIVMKVSGAARSILQAERLVLNCMQRMSGIATKTRHLVSLIEGTSAQLLDTRKTTPNFRLFEKWAVYIGGGQNHRMGLYDMMMLKDNHIDYAGGIRQALLAADAYRQQLGKPIQIEIETRNLEEVKEVLATGIADIIMLDNMTPADMREAVKLINGRMKVEASGNINEQTIRSVAECGVDYISVGALTHSYQSLDISLKAVK